MQPLSSAVSHGKELYSTNSPSASPVTVVRIIRLRVRVPHVAAAIWGRGLVKEIHYFGVFKTLVVAAAATVYQEPHFYVKARNSLHFCLAPKNFAFEFIAARDLI